MKPLLFTLCILFPLVWVQAQISQREAYHELSHALVAQNLGAIVNEINLDVTAEERGANYIYDRNLLRRQRAMVSIAGFVGEWVFLKVNNPAGSQADFGEAARVYDDDLNALVPDVAAILQRYQSQMPAIAAELGRTRRMTGQRLRQLIGAPEPAPDHPANKAEGAFIRTIGSKSVHIGGKPPWAGDGWNQAYTDWQDKFEGPLCLFSALALGIWGVVCIWLHSKGRLTRGHWAAYKVCFVVLLAWVGISTYVMYGTKPSN